MTIEKPEKKYKLGLSLSGGGARGFAHPGAIKAIEEAGMKPDVIAGTSAGAFAGVLYADGYSPEEIIELFLGKNLLQFAEIKVPTIAIFGTAGFRRFLKKHLRAKNFENLQIPMKVIATNLEEGLTTVFEQGPIIDALVASCSIPVVFPPVKIGNASYMDGGIFKNFPVSIIRSECEKIIGVNVSPLVSKKSTQSIMHIAERTFHYMSRNNTLLDRNLCDILIEMKDLVDYNILDLKSAAKIFKLGYENAQKSLNNSPIISPFE